MRAQDSTRNRQQWNGGPPSTTPPGQRLGQARRRELSYGSPEGVGGGGAGAVSRLDQEEEVETYVAAGTAPVGRGGAPSPPKSVSPVTSMTRTNYAGFFPAPHYGQSPAHTTGYEKSFERSPPRHDLQKPPQLPPPQQQQHHLKNFGQSPNDNGARMVNRQQQQQQPQLPPPQQQQQLQQKDSKGQRRTPYWGQQQHQQEKNDPVSQLFRANSNHSRHHLQQQQQAPSERNDAVSKLFRANNPHHQQQQHQQVSSEKNDAVSKLFRANQQQQHHFDAWNHRRTDYQPYDRRAGVGGGGAGAGGEYRHEGDRRWEQQQRSRSEATPSIYPQVSGQGALHSSVPNIRLPTYAEMLLPKDQQHKRRQGEPQKRDRLEETRESPASTPGAADTTLVASETTPADESSKSDSVLLPGSPACEETTTTTTPSSTLNNAPPTPPPSEPVDSCGNFEVSRMDVLSEQIWDFHNQITQKNETLTKKLSLRDMLYYAISPVFPMCGLYVVGSSLNGFGNDRSDMDLCLMITNKDLDQKTDAVVVLNMILTTLQKMDWVTYQKLILAKVPILRIRFAAPYDDITVDLNANNSVAIKNTHLLCYYSSFDWRVRPLVSIVKEWAKRKGINDANRSSFTSYSLVLMVIHYLQCGMQPALLPSLQTKFPKRFHPRVDVRMLSVTQPLAADLDWTFHEKATLGELLIGFLKYFSSKFDYDSHAISVREGKLITRKAVTRSRSNNFNNSNNNVTWRSQWRCICIEEPFTFSNTAHSIYDEMVFDAIKKSFKEAHDELERTRDINRLLECSPITVVPPIHGATAYVYDGVSREATLESGNGHGAAVVAATAATATAAATTPAATSVAAAVAAGAPSPSSR